MADITSGSIVTLKQGVRELRAFALEDFSTDDDKTVKVRVIETEDAIGPTIDANPSTDNIKLEEAYKGE